MIIDTNHIFLSKLDQVSDYLPVISSVTNFIDIFQKCVIQRFLSEAFLQKSHYYRHLRDKSILRCVILLIPVIGNIVILLYDFINYRRGVHFLNLGLKLKGGSFSEKQEAVKHFKVAVEKGNPIAMSHLAFMHSNGEGVPKNYVEAFKLYFRLLDTDAYEVESKLGLFFDNGLGVDRNYGEALKWYGRSAKKGISSSNYALGILHLHGRGVEQNEIKACGYFTLGAEQGDIDSMVQLGHLYYAGKEIAKDSKKSFSWFSKAADKGDAAATFWVGTMHEEGANGEIDLIAAFENYFKSAQSNDVLGMFKTGMCYKFGHGVAIDHTEAFKWTLKAAENGNVSSHYFVGEMCLRGVGVEEHKENAVKHFKNGQAMGDPRSTDMLALCLLQGIGGVRDEIQAYDCLMKASEMRFGNRAVLFKYTYEHIFNDREFMVINNFVKAMNENDVEAMRFLASAFMNGDGVVKDPKIAFEWFQKAAKLNDSISACMLGGMFELGNGVSEDQELAKSWYMKAMMLGNTIARERYLFLIWLESRSEESGPEDTMNSSSENLTSVLPTVSVVS